MDDEREQQIRALLADEVFGVLVLQGRERLHTATIHFAHTEDFEFVYAIDPVTLKGQLAVSGGQATFQVDNRALATRQPERFVRLSVEGSIGRVADEHPEQAEYRRVYQEKLAAGAQILASPTIALYVLRPMRMRIAVGGESAEDLAITFDDDIAAESVAGVPNGTATDRIWAMPDRPVYDAPDERDPIPRGERE